MLWLDTETYSEVPITNGTYAYASDCEVMIFTYALDDEKVSAIDLTNDEHPYDIPELKYALSNPTELVTAHNAMFDRNVLRFALNMEIAIPRWRDTMVQAFTLSLPGSLDKLCDIYRIGEDKAKLKDGAKLIQLFCKPRPKNAKLRRATRLTHPEDWTRFIQYAINDTEAMRAVAKKMPTWNYKGANLDYWHLDQKVNDRGILIDLDLARAALRAIDREQASLRKQTHDATNGAVSSTTKRDALLEHILQQYGISVGDLQKDTVERLLDDPDLPDGLKELLKIRLQASMASTSKYTKLIKATNSDGRLRGTIQFRGAGRTGRASGRTFQPQNLPRPNMKSAEIERGIEAMKLDCADMIYGNVMSLASNAIRGCIIAPPGKKLVIADLSNIEGRGVAYLAGEKWKLDAFRRYDTFILDANGLRIPDGKGDFIREGEDLYKIAYGRAFGVPAAEATGDKRQIGKVMELMLAYEGGVGAYITGAATYRIDLDQMTRMSRPNIPDEIWNEAVKFWHWSHKTKRPTYGLSHDVFCACDSLKRLWRLAHPNIVSFWREVADAVVNAIREPDVTFLVRKLKIRRTKEWLLIALPSGRCLCYPSPRVDNEGKISYEGVNQYVRKWGRISTYSGKLVENIVQAFSCDVFYHGKLPAEEAGYEIILEVHDEFITEVPDSDSFSAEGLSKIMSTNPPWAEGMPIAAAGFETYRYKKG